MMKMKRKTRLAMAVGGAIAGAAASGLVLAQGDEMGQIVTFPYYTVNGGWQTLFNVTNTTSAALAVKVRFHEAQNSRDVLDFTILMSPYDAWTGWVEPYPATGGMVLKTTDNSCTSPTKENWTLLSDGSRGLPARKAAYTGDFADGGPDTSARLTSGYAELILMGKCSPDEACFKADADGDGNPGIGYLTSHDASGAPVDCATADSYFKARNPTGTGKAVAWTENSGVPGSGNPIAAGDAAVTDGVLGDPRGYNGVAWYYAYYGYYGYDADSAQLAFPLKGNETLVNIANGVAGGNAALHFGNVIGYYAEGAANLVTAQQYPWFLEPTMATVSSGELWNAEGLGYLEYEELNELTLLNEWSSNPDLGVATDWIVTFPTKGFHVDQFCDQIQANNNAWRVDGSHVLECDSDKPANYAETTASLPEPSSVPGSGGIRNPYYPPSLGPFANRWADGKSDIVLDYTLYDREEGSQQGSETAPSPAPPTPLPKMPYEANVLAFTSVADPNRDGFALPEGSAVASPDAQQIDASAILGGAPNGWMDIVLPCSDDDGGYVYCYPYPTMQDGSPTGLPVTGFMVKTRTFGTPDMHYGQIQNHGYRPGYSGYYDYGPFGALSAQ